MPEVLKGANVTAQWYQDSFLGTLFAFLEKACLHSTETKGWPGYSGGASAPNATYFPLRREIRQHFENNRSARALRDPSSTPVRENRDRVWQLEIIAYSDHALARSVGGLWIGDLTDAHFTDIAWMLIQLAQDLDLPLRTDVRWAEGQKTYVTGRRLTSAQFDAARGILAHFHVSGNTHWDVGGFFISRLMAKIAQLLDQEDDDMTTPEERKQEMREVLAERVITLDWDGGPPGAKEVSIFEALSYIHFNAADSSFVGTVPDTSTRASHRGRDTFAKDLQESVDQVLAKLPPGEGDPVEPPGEQ